MTTPLLQTDTLNLTVTPRDSNSVIVGWDPVPGCAGYRLTRQGWLKADGTQRYSMSWNPARASAVFEKAAWYQVEALVVGDWGRV